LFRQERLGGGPQLRVGGPELSRPVNPAALIAGKPGPVGRPGQEVGERLGQGDARRVISHGTSREGVRKDAALVSISNIIAKRQRGRAAGLRNLLTQAPSASDGAPPR